VAIAGEVGRNATVSAIGAPAAIDCTLDDSMVDGAFLEIKAFGLSIGAQVDEQLTDGLDRLLGPSTEGGVLERLDLGVTSNTTCVASVWDDLLLLLAVFKVGDSSVEFPSLQAAGYIVGILVVNAEVRNLGFGGFSGFRRLS